MNEKSSISLLSLSIPSSFPFFTNSFLSIPSRDPQPRDMVDRPFIPQRACLGAEQGGKKIRNGELQSRLNLTSWAPIECPGDLEERCLCEEERFLVRAKFLV